MKTRIIWIVALLIIPFFNSCEKEEILGFSNPDAKWTDFAKLKFEPSDGITSSFEYNVVLGQNQQYWNVTDLDFNVTVDLGENTKVSEISKIDIYAFAEEKNGDNYNYLGGKSGKLLTTIDNPTEIFKVSISKDDIEELFKNDFSANHNGEILFDDIFELKWVITGKDGNVLDTRAGCYGFDCSFGFGTKIVEVAPPIWEGTFNYEWIELTDDAAYWGRVSVGQTGTMTFTLQPGSYTVYDVSHLAADYYYSGPGTLTYGYEEGTIELSGGSDTFWDIVDIDGPTLTIDFSYYYSLAYNEYGTFTLTRTDGEDWPDNLKGI